MTSPHTAFTDALPSQALVPLPAVVEGVADPECSKQQRPWVVGNWSALDVKQRKEKSATAAPDEHNASTLDAGGEILRALRLRGWRASGDYGAPASLMGREPEGIFAVDTLITATGEAEGYRLRCLPVETPTQYGETLRVQVEAATAAGFFYAGLTLAALACAGALQEGCLVEDEPRFAHRGLMVDVARSFLPIDALRDLVSAVASLKINVLHLHLVDDQGWRLEITNEGRAADDPADYTALHRRGGLTACNPGTNPGFDVPGAAMSEVHAMNAGYETIAAGIPGYYTQAELRELVAYAASMHVDVVPELEFPGHNHVVLHALPHLATAGPRLRTRARACPRGRAGRWATPTLILAMRTRGVLPAMSCPRCRGFLVANTCIWVETKR